MKNYQKLLLNKYVIHILSIIKFFTYSHEYIILQMHDMYFNKFEKKLKHENDKKFIKCLKTSLLKLFTHFLLLFLFLQVFVL